MRVRKRAEGVIEVNRENLARLACMLLAEETIDGKELEAILADTAENAKAA